MREVSALRSAVIRARALHPFTIDAWVVLPDHMHAVWTLPADNADFSVRWTLIKRGFSAAMPDGERRSASRVGKGERGVWQRRLWEHTIRDERDFATHVEYVHFNPVKHGLVHDAFNWPFSSIHRAAVRGEYAQGWKEDCLVLPGSGERR